MLLERYAKANFENQRAFERDFRINVPDNFNYAFDCLDVLADTCPDKTAMVWCNDKGDAARYTFAQMARLADAAARYFASLGIGRGDAVMLWNAHTRKCAKKADGGGNLVCLICL